MAAIVFVAVDPRIRHLRLPKRRQIVEGARPDGAETRDIIADVADRHRPAKQPSRQEEVPGLAAEEGHGLPGDDGAGEDRAGAAVDAARQIDREDRRAAFIGAVHDEAGGPVDRPVETGAEQRVDDEVRALAKVAPRIFDRSVPGARREAASPFSWSRVPTR